MSNVIMRIVGVKVAGASSIGGALAAGSLKKDSLQAGEEWFNIDSISWNAERKSSGLSSMSPIEVTRKLDGASEKIMALFFKPGDKGVKVEIAFTKEATTGEGVVKVYEIKLDKVRIAEYKVEAEDEAAPTETFTLTYTEISQNVSVEDGAGMANIGDVTFDLASATLTSAMKDALK